MYDTFPSLCGACSVSIGESTQQRKKSKEKKRRVHFAPFCRPLPMPGLIELDLSVTETFGVGLIPVQDTGVAF